jgi:hypothetical protein
LLPRTAIVGRQYQIQIVGAGIDHAERLAEIVNQAAHVWPNPLLERVGERGGDIGIECEHLNLNSGGEDDYNPVVMECKYIYAGI